MSGAVALAVLAVVGKSVIMFVSAAAIAVISYPFRRARVRDRVIGIIAAGLGGSIGAEIVHTLYKFTHVSGFGTVSDGGGFFMTAILVGLVNATAIVVLVLCTESWLKYVGRKSE